MCFKTIASLWIFLLSAWWVQPSEAPARPPAAVSPGSGGVNVKFQWACTGLVGNSKPRDGIVITNDTTLKRGDEIELMVVVQTNCFVYVLRQDTRKQVHLLFPYHLKQFEEDYRLNTKYYIPQGPGYLQLDQNAGLESIFLLASAQRLVPLEKLLQSHLSADETRKPELANSIIKEIGNLRVRSRLSRTLAERPVRIGGGTRGDGEVKAGERYHYLAVGTEITERDFYDKAISIEIR